MTDSTKQPMTFDGSYLLEVIADIRQALGDTDKLMLNELSGEITKRQANQSAIVAELEAKLEWWRELFPSITPAAAVEYQTVYDKACKAEKLNAELLKALGDLSFECFGVIGTCAPSIATYNRTFEVLDRIRKQHSPN